jgi:predicted CXXCH cytochrome family protein
MTQELPDAVVRGRFDGQPLDWLGVRAVPRRSGAGYEIELPHPRTGERRAFPVVRTVGSRRMQQYVTRMGDRHVRLPVAFSIEEDRWFHLSEAFFHPDGESYHTNTAVWDLNCIFCHNVKARPGRDARVRVGPEVGPEGRIDSSVAELGIACEACHGPGEVHAERMRSPLRRLGFGLKDSDDPTIVHPGKLDQRRSAQVCGHCHGQRLPNREEDIQTILRDGDPFTPGEDLSRYYQPIHASSAIGSYSLAPRFWPDGSPRLTAHEYQGLTTSPCFERGTMTCLSCHAMHAGDPHGQLRPDRPGNSMCTQCHGDFDGPRLEDHTRHAAASTGSQCVACHMPPVVYGVMSWHPSHQIQSPDPRAAARLAMPDACTTCHTGRSRSWAATERERLWGPAPSGTRPGDRPLPRVPEIPRALLAGDVVYRTLAAARLAEDSPEPDAGRFAVPILGELLLDPYPNVRRTARLALLRWAGSGIVVPYAHDPLAERLALRDLLTARPLSPVPPLAAGWPFDPGGRPIPELLQSWAAERVEVPVSIGE